MVIILRKDVLAMMRDSNYSRTKRALALETIFSRLTDEEIVNTFRKYELVEIYVFLYPEVQRTTGLIKTELCQKIRERLKIVSHTRKTMM